MKRRFLIWVLLMIYMVLIIVLLFLQYSFELDVRLTEKLDRSKIHGPLSLIGVLFCGLGLMIYRLFRGFRTRIIKYLHMLCQTLAIIFIFVGYAYSSHFGNRDFSVSSEAGTDTKTSEMHITSEAHVAIGYLMLGSIVLQYAVGSFVFVYLFADSKTRLVFAPFHDIFGIWIFLCLVAAHLTGVHFLYDAVGSWAMDSNGSLIEKLNYMSLPAYMGFLLVFIVLICPYLEWELVGPI